MVSFTTGEYYTNTYLNGVQAVIDTALFPLYARKATQTIKQHTFDNVDESLPFQEELQMCCCELAEYLFKQDNKDHADDVQAEKKGEWSTTYISMQDAEKMKRNEIKSIVYNWLSLTGLLYRGC